MQSPRRRAGERVPTVTPVQINSSYAHTREELQLFQEDLAACSPEEHLSREAALEAVRTAAHAIGGQGCNTRGAARRRMRHAAPAAPSQMHALSACAPCMRTTT
jgi:hypothetical protein